MPSRRPISPKTRERLLKRYADRIDPKGGIWSETNEGPGLFDHWAWLKDGWVCPATDCGTVHESTVADFERALRFSVYEPSEQNVRITIAPPPAESAVEPAPEPEPRPKVLPEPVQHYVARKEPSTVTFGTSAAGVVWACHRDPGESSAHFEQRVSDMGQAWSEVVAQERFDRWIDADDGTTLDQLLASDVAAACPHGESPASCDACDRLGDLAFDADREARVFGK